ncbi:MAG: hypothetical protein WB818_00280, partial [Desulfobacterales bacterium]
GSLFVDGSEQWLKVACFPSAILFGRCRSGWVVCGTLFVIEHLTAAVLSIQWLVSTHVGGLHLQDGHLGLYGSDAKALKVAAIVN